MTEQFDDKEVVAVSVAIENRIKEIKGYLKFKTIGERKKYWIDKIKSLESANEKINEMF